MFLMETLAGFDALALGVIVGSAGLVGGLIWVLVDNREFEGFKPAANRTVADDRPSADGGPAADYGSSATKRQSGGEPRSPRAA